MKTGIFADLHGNIEALHTILDGVFADTDRILCAGDTFGSGLGNPFSPWYQPQKVKEVLLSSKIPVVQVRGNCDPKGLYPDSETGEVNGKTFYLCHGQHCPTDADKLSLATRHSATFFIYGHTHEWRLEQVNGVYLINPGSPTMPKKRPHHDTVAVLTENEIYITDIHTKEVLASISLH